MSADADTLRRIESLLGQPALLNHDERRQLVEERAAVCLQILAGFWR